MGGDADSVRERRMSKPGVSDFFSKEDLSRITDAVADAERGTSAEIVPCILDRSDDYEEALWRAGGLMSSVVLGGLGIVNALTGAWLPFGLAGVAAIVLLIGAGTMLAVMWIPSLRRICAGKELLTLRVMRKAKELFLDEQVFRTRQRTGILLLISLLEREVVVLADTGITSRVNSAEWKPVIDCVLNGLRSGKPTDGVVGALRMMSPLLERHGFVRPSDDGNELPDRLRGEGTSS
jgi:putative membrane protein